MFGLKLKNEFCEDAKYGINIQIVYIRSKVINDKVRFLADFIKNAHFAYVFIYSVQTAEDMKNLRTFITFKIL